MSLIKGLFIAALSWKKTVVMRGKSQGSSETNQYVTKFAACGSLIITPSMEIASPSMPITTMKMVLMKLGK